MHTIYAQKHKEKDQNSEFFLLANLTMKENFLNEEEHYALL